METARLSRYEDLIQYLAASNVPRRENHAERSVEVQVVVPPLTGSVYMRWDQHLPYIQVSHPLVFDVPPERIADLETAITRVNESLAVPGLGFHHDKRFLYMRRCVPVYADGISTVAFQKQLADLLEVARQWIGPLKQVVAGKPGNEILNLAGPAN